MTRRTPLHRALSIALAFAASGACAQSLPSVGGEPALPPKAEAPLAWRDAGSVQAIQSAPRQVYGPMAAERIAELAASNKANGYKRLHGEKMSDQEIMKEIDHIWAEVDLDANGSL